MNTHKIHPERIRKLNDRPILHGAHVVYWMQTAQRAHDNDALEFAIAEANRLDAHLLVYFGLFTSFPEANLRHFTFMIEGLIETRRDLQARGIPLIIRNESPEAGVLRLSDRMRLLVCDTGYLRLHRKWRAHVAEHAVCRVVQVETEPVVPIGVVTDHEAYSAATIRKKIQNRMAVFLDGTPRLEHRNRRIDPDLESLSDRDLADLLTHQISERVPGPAPTIRGGRSEAMHRLERLMDRLDLYDLRRNDPGEDVQSGLSPYLHFGQVSAREIARRVRLKACAGAEAFLEELIVRRELAMNFVFFNPVYDDLDCLPAWARKTLDRHAADPREVRYSRQELEAGRTADPYWNAAQIEMLLTGKMHGYMRMYWGKKLIEWLESPREAYRFALYLNNRYEIDGRDANGYAGVAWCFGKHDRPWAERPIFGMVRYMAASGLERKFEIRAYCERVRSIQAQVDAV